MHLQMHVSSGGRLRLKPITQVEYVGLRPSLSLPLSSFGNLKHLAMEPIGLAVGVAGLAGLFSSCLEAIERFDSYKNFDRDSRSLTTQFNAAKLLLEKWGRDVGIENGKLSDNHHPALDNGKTLEVVRKLLSSIQDFFGGPDDVALQIATSTDRDFLKSGPLPSRRSKHPRHRAPADSKWKMASWALSGKSKRTKHVQTVTSLVQYLYILVPINDTKEIQAGQESSATDIRGSNRFHSLTTFRPELTI